MPDTSRSKYQQAVAIPRGRLNRMARLGGLTTALAGNVAARGGMELLRGRRPAFSDLLMTPGNAARLTNQLARMRGAAMKAGQLLSMETADLMPPEMAEILSRLRSEGHFMPPAQLKKVLAAEWGKDFLKHFKRFDIHPIAAASIGQVHRAHTKDGRDLAIKVQYPGVRDSIDSDMRNLGMIARASGMVPKSFDVDRMLTEGAAQLHEETDYIREGEALQRFGSHLAQDDRFTVPGLHKDLSTRNILAMDFIEAIPIERLADGPQETRDAVATAIIDLTLHELFGLRDMQTDPNFANYLFQPENGRIVLLDFGATQTFGPDLVTHYAALFAAAVSGDDDAAFEEMVKIGLVPGDMDDKDRQQVLSLFGIAAEPLRQGGVLDFGTCGLLARLRRAGLVLAEEKVTIHAPPTETLLLQRKVLGCYLLAERLRARVDLDPLIARYV